MKITTGDARKNKNILENKKKKLIECRKHVIK